MFRLEFRESNGPSCAFEWREHPCQRSLHLGVALLKEPRREGVGSTSVILSATSCMWPLRNIIWFEWSQVKLFETAPRVGSHYTALCLS